MQMQPQPPSTNGNHPAPRTPRGAVVVRAPVGGIQSPTLFPAPLPAGGTDDLLFTFGRGAFLGFPLGRVITFVVILLALTLALRRFPGGGWVASALLAALAIVVLARTLAARRGFVRFFAEAGDGEVAAEALPGRDKLPIYLWGNLEVQGRVRSFAALPGFYRTFATREHALIGQVVSNPRLGVAKLADVDAGLWYAFCTPEQVLSLRSGRVGWGRATYAAIALERRTARTQASGRTQYAVETLYLAAHEPETIQRILADLAVECKTANAPARGKAGSRDGTSSV